MFKIGCRLYMLRQVCNRRNQYVLKSAFVSFDIFYQNMHIKFLGGKESDFDSDYKNAALEDIRFVNGDKDDKIEHRAHNEKHACHKNRSFFMHAKQSNVSNQRVG